MRLETGCLSARESTLPEALRPASLGSGSECPGIRRTPRGGSRARSSGEYPDPLARGSRRHIAIRIECPTTRGRRKRFLAAALERRRRVEGSLAGDGEARGRCVLRDRGGLESGRFLRGARLLEGSRRERDAKTLGLRRAPRGRIRSTFGRLPDRAAGAAESPAGRGRGRRRAVDRVRRLPGRFSRSPASARGTQIVAADRPPRDPA